MHTYLACGPGLGRVLWRSWEHSRGTWPIGSAFQVEGGEGRMLPGCREAGSCTYSLLQWISGPAKVSSSEDHENLIL